MMRPLALVVAATLCVGCQTPTALVDPFLGRQTVPPPSTGVATHAPPDSSYYNAPKSPTASIPGGGVSNSPYAPPGGNFSYKSGDRANPSVDRGAAPLSTPASLQNSNSRSNSGAVPLRSANPDERPPQASNSIPRNSAASGSFVNNNPQVKIVEPTRTVSSRNEPATIARAPYSGSPKSSTSKSGVGNSRQPTDIMKLPDARATTRPTPNSSSGFRPVGGVNRANFEEASNAEPLGNRPAARTSRIGTLPAAAAGTQYGHDRDYRRLNGKLEYSRTDDRWKLRYIPIDGETDDYGGSVVLLGSRALEDYKAGEFVTVSGRIEEAGGDSRGYAPSFRVDRVEPQGG